MPADRDVPRHAEGARPARGQVMVTWALRFGRVCRCGWPGIETARGCRPAADTKKRELVGNFKNQGSTWEQSPQAVNDHDFRSQADGIAIPYGVYDLCANRGFVSCRHLPRHPRLRCRQPGMVAARRPRTVPRRLRTAGARRLRRQQRPTHPLLQVCTPDPPRRPAPPQGHRLSLPQRRFQVEPHRPSPGEISKNWAGHPLRSYQTILNHIRTTTTDTGLCVTAQLVDQEYPKGVKISDAQFASIALQPHQVQPLRNYTICPRP